VTEVVAVEPERRLAVLAQQAAAAASVPVTVSTDTVEQFSDGEPFDAAVCSLVLCSVEEPDQVVTQLLSLLKPGGELRYLEHVASSGARARLQKIADATVWPRIAGNCHTHQHTEDDRRRRVHGVRRAPGVGDAGLGAHAGRGVRDRPRGQAGLSGHMRNCPRSERQRNA